MKKSILVTILLMIIFLTTACKSEYVGYWCRYDETATIVVLLKDNNTEKQKNKIEEKINSFTGIVSLNYYSKEDYAKDLGKDIEDLDIYDNYVVMFSSVNNIGTYVDELAALSGVKEAKQVNAKANVSLYNLQSNGKYTYANSDEAKEEDIIKGNYKIRKGVVILTPDDGKQTLLYTKNGHLCEDADCTKIFAKSGSSCNAN